MRPVVPVALALATFALLPHEAPAQTFKCRNDFVNVGDARATVLLKCGEPVVRDAFCRPFPVQGPRPASGPRPGQIVPCENVDEWVYNPGYGQFMTTLRFVEGRLAAIDYGDRVK
ncbi:MAG: DUF2845 domain-containing protein [Caldimonas sp.]